MTRHAISGARIFDGARFHDNGTLVLDDDAIVGIENAESDECPTRHLDGGVILPGFVDLQVNGGGGVMFNDAPTVETLATISNAHRTLGTTAFLPTLITDTPETTRAAIRACIDAIADGVDGIAGLHLEGPHLSQARKGAHDAALIRPMTDDDEAMLCDAAGRLPNLLVTLAPETVPPEQIARLVRAGMTVSLGHSACSYEQAEAAIEAGATMVTHLFNAMSQITARDPGLAGAALASGRVSAGLIADGIHVHPETIGMALRAKQGPGGLFLVTDAMATAGSDIVSFTLNGRRITRSGNRLALDDGTLAGAHLSLERAVSIISGIVGADAEAAFAMATSGPASLLVGTPGLGQLAKGTSPGVIWLSDDGQVTVLAKARIGLRSRP